MTPDRARVQEREELQCDSSLVGPANQVLSLCSPTSPKRVHPAEMAREIHIAVSNSPLTVCVDKVNIDTRMNMGLFSHAGDLQKFTKTSGIGAPPILCENTLQGADICQYSDEGTDRESLEGEQGATRVVLFLKTPHITSVRTCCRYFYCPVTSTTAAVTLNDRRAICAKLRALGQGVRLFAAGNRANSFQRTHTTSKVGGGEAPQRCVNLKTNPVNGNIGHKPDDKIKEKQPALDRERAPGRAAAHDSDGLSDICHPPASATTAATLSNPPTHPSRSAQQPPLYDIVTSSATL
ncbi:hypothetical protein CBL_05316 [Carabus blaptoides fortunei]